MSQKPNDPVARAMAAWGDAIPAWVVVLAEACQMAGSQSAVAKRLEYSATTVSQILSKTYLGNIGRVEQMVRGALMAETVVCPMLGDVARNVCLDWQSKPYSPTSSHRVAMFRACRDGCPNSRISSDQGGVKCSQTP